MLGAWKCPLAGGRTCGMPRSARGIEMPARTEDVPAARDFWLWTLKCLLAGGRTFGTRRVFLDAVGEATRMREVQPAGASYPSSTFLSGP